MQICLDSYRMIIIVQISMGSIIMLGDLMAYPPEKILKSRYFEIEFEGILGSSPYIIALHAGSYQVTVSQI